MTGRTAAMKWHEAPMVAFDTETTGVDPATARIVTAAAVFMTPGERPRTIRWIVDPEVEIPAEASDVHGWTNARLASEIGRPGFALRYLNGQVQRIPREAAIFEIVGQVGATIGREHALVVHNAAYDLTLLEYEAVRHDVDTLAARPAGIRGVVDPMVIEKQYDPFRKTCYKAAGCRPEDRHHECGGCRGGKVACGGCGATDRTLGALCRHYGVVHAGAHDCADDAIAAARLLRRLVAAWPQIGVWRLGTLHEHQVTWRRSQAEGLREFFVKVGKPVDDIDTGWPVHSSLVGAAPVLGGAA